jgi:hypothetical protein
MRESWFCVLAIVTIFTHVQRADGGEREEVYQALEVDRCDRTTEVFYRSQTLQSPDNGSSVYFESVYRKQGLRGGLRRVGLSCHSESVGSKIEPQTPIQRMVIENGGIARTINLDPLNDAYGFLTPQSFSLDGRFFVVHEVFILSSGGVIEGPLVFDILGNNNPFRPDCNSDHCYFRGFISSTNFLVNIGRASSIIIDLRAQSYQFTQNSQEGKTYGTVTSPSQITKIQHFPLR